MATISFKIPEDDKHFLEWYSKRSATPVGSLYRTVTQKEFHRWKLQLLVSLYGEGEIGFTEMCNLGNISLTKGMLILEDTAVEPPIPDIVDDYTIALTLKNIQDESGERLSNFKKMEMEFCVKPMKKHHKDKWIDQIAFMIHSPGVIFHFSHNRGDTRHLLFSEIQLKNKRQSVCL